jgi:hypothetical protein
MKIFTLCKTRIFGASSTPKISVNTGGKCERFWQINSRGFLATNKRFFVFVCKSA